MYNTISFAEIILRPSEKCKSNENKTVMECTKFKQSICRYVHFSKHMVGDKLNALISSCLNIPNSVVNVPSDARMWIFPSKALMTILLLHSIVNWLKPVWIVEDTPLHSGLATAVNIEVSSHQDALTLSNLSIESRTMKPLTANDLMSDLSQLSLKKPRGEGYELRRKWKDPWIGIN